jgi:quinol monooxygenase YgiN
MGNFDRLVENGAKRDELLWKLDVVWFMSHPSMELHKLRTKDANARANRIEHAANLIEQLNDGWRACSWLPYELQVPVPRDTYPKSGSPSTVCFSWRHLELLPQALREYADRVRKLPGCVSYKWKPARTAAVSQLIWYVKMRTEHWYDEDVSALLSAVLSDDHLTPQAVKQFRKRNADMISKEGPRITIPLLPRRPR